MKLNIFADKIVCKYECSAVKIEFTNASQLSSHFITVNSQQSTGATCLFTCHEHLCYHPLAACQWDFLEGRSTVTALLHCTNEWLKPLEDGKEVCAVFFDFRKAFNSVPHARMSKLVALGLDDHITCWLLSCQQVPISGPYLTQSQWCQEFLRDLYWATYFFLSTLKTYTSCGQ